MERIKRHFTEQGLSAADIPVAIVIHEVLGLGMAAGFWATCYSLQPSRTFLHPLLRNSAGGNASLQRGYAAAVSKAQVFCCCRSGSVKLPHLYVAAPQN